MQTTQYISRGPYCYTYSPRYTKINESVCWYDSFHRRRIVVNVGRNGAHLNPSTPPRLKLTKYYNTPWTNNQRAKPTSREPTTITRGLGHQVPRGTAAYGIALMLPTLFSIHINVPVLGEPNLFLVMSIYYFIMLLKLTD